MQTRQDKRPNGWHDRMLRHIDTNVKCATWLRNILKLVLLVFVPISFKSKPKEDPKPPTDYVKTSGRRSRIWGLGDD